MRHCWAAELNKQGSNNEAVMKATDLMDQPRLASEALRQMDRVVVELEEQWGKDVLPLLVEPDLRSKFEAQLERLNSLLQSDDEKGELSPCAEAMTRAWRALDASARASGHKPRTEAVWVGHHPSFGYCCVYTGAASIGDLPADLPRFHIDELLRLVPELLWKAKGAFPGARVTALSPLPAGGDEIPF